MKQLNNDPTFDEKVDTTTFGLYQSVPTAFLILLPLSLKEDMAAFRYVSLASILCLVYTGIVLIVEAPSYYQHNKDLPTTEIVPIYWNLDILSGCAMTFYAYQC